MKKNLSAIGLIPIISGLFTIALLFLTIVAGAQCGVSCSGGPAPANDACSVAQNLGALPVPNGCPSGVGAWANFNTTNLCATAESPYTALTGCQPAGNMASPAADVWYRFTITAPTLNVNISGLQSPNIGLYAGTACNNLIGRGCAVGGGGILNTSFGGLAPGTYYLQVSGGNLSDQCDFTLGLQNNYDCAGCVIASSFTANPPPANGMYLAGQAVTFCLTISNYNQTSINWLHAVTPVFGPGWNMSTLTTVPAVSCDGQGFWQYYNQTFTSTATGLVTGPGFFYESPLGDANGGYPDGNPGDNYGDNNPSNTCDWTFCWTISTMPVAQCVQGASLNISVDTYGDGESGSWTSLACSGDAVIDFFATLACCEPPVVNVTNIPCFGQTTGAATGNGQGNGPWDYIWKNGAGATIQTTNNVNGANSISGLPAGNYTLTVIDNAGCSAVTAFAITQPALLVPNPVATNIACFGAANGSISVNPTGGTAGFNYQWSPAMGNVATVTNLTNGTYTVTVTDANGCTASATVNITQPTQLTFNTNITPASCAGNTGSITINAGGGTGALQYSINGGVTFQAGNVFNSLAAGNYNVVVQDASGCLATAIVAINASTAPVINSTPFVNINCSGGTNGSITINAAGGTGALQYSINGGGTFQAGNVFNGLPAGTYNIVVQDANNCQVTATVNITEPNPIVVVPNATGSTCSNYNGSITVNANGGTGALQYSINNGATYQAGNIFNGLTAGNYNIVVQDANGCTATGNIAVSNAAGPTITSIANTNVNCNGGTDGSVTVNTNGGTPPVQCSIDGGATYQAGNNFTNLPAGSYNVAIIDANGCTATGTINITEPNPINVNGVTIDATCGSSNGSITVNANGGVGALQYSTDGGATYQAGNVFNGLPAGNYNVVVQDANGCTGTAVIAVNNAAAPVINSVPFIDIICFGGTNGSITINGSGGTGALQYSIDNGTTFQAGNVFNNLTAGTYNIVIQDANGCQVSTSVNITEPPVLIVNPSSVTSTCGASNGSITINANGGTGALQYSINNGATYQAGNNFNGLAAGNYNIIVQDASGCTSTTVIAVSNEPSPIIVSTPSTNVSCNAGFDGTITINSNGGTGAILYSIDGGTTFQAGNIFNGLPAGNYNIVVQDANSCTVSTNVNIAEPTPIAVNPNSATATCGLSNGTITVNANGGTGALQYSIDGGATYQGGSTFSGLASGNYSIVVQDANGCTGTGNISVADAPGPALTSVPSNNVSCFAGNNGSITINANGGTGLLQYSIDNGATYQAGINFNNLPAGTYNVVVQDVNGCTVTTTVNISEPPQIVFNTNQVNTICSSSNGSITVNANGGTGTLQYSINGGTNFQASNIFNSIPAGSYNIVVEDANGCTATSVLNVTDAPSPTIASTPVVDVSCNGGNNGTIIINGNGGTGALQYSIDGGTTFQAGNNFSGLPAGNYNIVVQDANGCTVTTVVAIAEPTPIVINTNSTVETCGSSNGTITINANGGTGVLQYSNDNGATFQAGNTFSGIPGGNCNIVVQDDNGCTSATIAFVPVEPSPTISATPVVDVTCNAGTNGSITINASGGTGVIQYSIDGGTTYQAGNIFNGLSAGSYNVVILDANGCTVTASVTIAEPAALVLNPNAVTSTCGNSNGSINIVANGGTGTIQYSIDGGVTYQAGSTFSGLASGNYTIVIQDANGCTATSNINVPNAASPTIVTTPVVDVTCNAGSNGSITINSNGGTGAIQYSIDNGVTYQAGNIFNGLPAGNYSIIIQDANGCTATANATIAEPTTLNLIPSAVTATCSSSNGSITITAGGGTGAIQYSIDNGATYQAGNIFNNLPAGNYVIIVQDANGCTATSNINVPNEPSPTIVSTPIVDVTCNAGTNGSITINSNGGTGAIQYSIDNGATYQPGNIFNGLPAGNYQVIIQDANGCTAATNATIAEPTAVAFNANTVTSTCGASNGSITINGNGGTGTLQFSIDGGATFQSGNTFNGLPAGNYNIVVQDANGCQANGVASVSNALAPAISSAPVIDVTCNGGTNGSIIVNANGGTGALQYSIDNGITFQAGNSFTNLPAGTYNIVVQDVNGCVASSAAIINEPNAVVFNANAVTATCSNSNGTITINAIGGTGAIQYSIDNGAIWQAGNIFNNLPTGNYSIIVQDANGCTASGNINVPDEPSPTIVSTPVVDVTCNAGTNGSITINSNGGTGAIQYSIDNGATYQAGNIFNGLPAGNYQIIIQDVNGCTTAANANITEPTAVVFNTNTVTATCNGSNGSITITGNGGTGALQFSIDGGATFQSGNIFNGLPAGNYNIVVQDANGCQANGVASVSNALAPVISSSPVVDVTCNGGTNGSITVNANGGTGALQFSIDNGVTYQAGNTFNNLPAGNYNIVVQDANGCSTTSLALISEPTAVVANSNTTTSTCGNNNGTVTVNGNGGTGTLQFSIDGGVTFQASGNFINLTAGNYNIIVQDANGCTASTLAVVGSEPSPVIVSAPVTDVSCNGGTDGSITINITGGTGVIQYSIDGGITFQALSSFSNLTGGNYAVVVQDANGCTVTLNIVVVEPAPININTVVTDASCGNSDGTIAILANGGNGGFQYSIDGGLTFQSGVLFNNLLAGNYNVIAQDANGCTATNVAVVNNAAAPAISSAPFIDVTCNGGNDGSITINANGGTGALMFSIDNGVTFQPGNIFNNLPAGTYNIIVQDANGCQASASINILEPTAVVFNANAATATCGNNNGSIAINANGGTGVLQYSIDGGITFQPLSSFNNLATGNYSIIVQDANGCTATSNINVPNAASPTIASTPVTDVTCNGGTNGSIIINANGGTGTIQFSVDNGITWQAGNTFNNLSAGNYSVIIQDANGCTATANAVIVQPAAINFNTLITDASCNQSDGTISVLANGGTGTFQYSIDGGVTFQSGQLFNNLLAGNYNIVVQDANGCTAANVAVVNNAAAPVISSSPFIDVTCNGGSDAFITINASGGTGALMFSIDNGVTFSPGNIFNNLPAGTYNIIVQDVNGCQASSSVVINEPLAVAFNANAVTSTCGNNNGSISINANGGTGTLQYSIDGGTTFQLVSSFNSLATGNYNIVVQDANGCSVTGAAFVNDEPSPTISTVNSTDLTCNGSNDGMISISAIGGTGVLQFSIDGGLTFQPLSNFNNLPAGNYSIIVQDVNACTVASNAVINQPAPVVINSSMVQSTCNNSNGEITINANGGSGTYQFSIDNGITFQSGNIFSNLPAGNYNVVVQDGSGCTSAAVVAVTNAASPVISSAPVTDASCFGVSDGSITINASGGIGVLEFSIDNGVTFQPGNVFSNLPAGTYSIVVQDANGCTITSAANITEPPQINFNAVTVSSSCGGSTGSVTVNANGGTGALQISIDGGVTFQPGILFPNLAAGNYNVVVMDATGCQATGVASVSNINGPVISNTAATDLTCFGSNNGTIVITANGGTGALNYSIDNGTTYQLTNSFSNLPGGIFSIVVTDGNNCIASANVLINEPAQIVFNTLVTDATCGNSNGTINVFANGGTGILQYSNNNGATYQGGALFNSLLSGNYTIVVQDANGCTAAALSVVSNLASPVISSTNVVDVDCNGANNGTITIIANGGTGTLEYSIDNGATFFSGNLFSNLPAGTYNIVIQDANGCTATTVANVIEPTAVAANANAVTATCGNNNGSIAINANGGTGALQYSIDNGITFQGGNIFNALASGNYNIIIQDANGCTAATSALVINAASPVISSTAVTDVLCNGGNDGTITVTANGGTGVLQYSIDGGTTFQPSNIFNNLTIGTYNIVVQDVNSCTAVSSENIIEPSAINVNSNSNPASCGNPDGSVLVNANGGTGIFQYSINGGAFQPGNLFNNLLAGNYSVVVQDANGCTMAGTASVVNTPDPVISAAAVTDVLCNGGSTGEIIITAASGTGSLLYSIDNGVSFQLSNIFNGLPAGNYNIVVQDALGCQALSSASLIEPTAVVANTTTVTATCEASNGSITVNANGGTGTLQYSIDGGATFQALSNFNNLLSGNYNIIVQDANGCTAATTAVVGNEASPVISSSLVTDVSCNGGSNGEITINTTGGTGALQYSIDGGTTFQPSNIFNGLTIGTYNIVVQDVNGCTAVSSENIIEPPAINISSSSNPASCGDDDGSVLITASGGTGTFQYSINGGAFQVGNLFNNLFAGNYSVIVQDANGCTSMAISLVSNTASPVVLSIQVTDVSCNGGSDGTITINANGGTGLLMYSLNGGATFQPAITFTNLSSGTYNIIVQDALGCQTLTVAGILQPAVLAFTSSLTDVLCNGGSDGTAGVTPTGGTAPYTYQWSNAGTTQNTNGLAAGNYSVIITDAHLCTTTQAFVINEPPVLVAVTTPTAVDCYGGNNGTITVVPSGGIAPYSYQWSSGGTNPVANNLSVGNYSVTITDAHGCTLTVIDSVTSPSLLVVNTTPVGVTCFGSNNGSVSAVAAGGTPSYAYLWSNGATTASITNLSAGVYKVTVTDDNNCVAQKTTTVIEPQSLVLNVAGTDTICISQSATISATVSGGTSPYSYIWNNGATTNTQIVSPGTTTTYLVNITDANGCTAAQQSVTITVSPALAVVASANNAICEGQSTTISAVASGGNGGPYTYSWNNNAGNSNSATVSPGQTTTYTVTVNDNCGTPVAMDNVTVTVNPLPDVLYVPEPPTGCVPLEVNFVDNSVTAIGSQYQWSFGDGGHDSLATNPVHTYYEPGTYTVSLTITTPFGCTSTLTIPNAVKVHSLPVAEFTPEPAKASVLFPVISFKDLSYDAALWAWDFGDAYGTSSDQHPKYSYRDTGRYFVTLIIENQYGCPDTAYGEVVIEGDYTIWIPNAFSPNGDGVNDYFQVSGIGISQIDMFIFNRWGDVVFTTNNINKGWNGKTLKENINCQEDVYVYLVKTVDSKGKKNELTGRVTLIR